MHNVSLTIFVTIRSDAEWLITVTDNDKPLLLCIVQSRVGQMVPESEI